jgi:Sigma-70, region 4
MASADPLLDMTWRELRTTLYEELARLPEKNRTPLVLCYLQGKTQGEAARLLGWTKETVRGRLDRGREQLRKRLTRRGLALSSALFSTLLVHDQALAVPASLLKTAVKNAGLIAAGQVTAGAISSKVAALASGGLRDLFLRKLKFTLAVLLAVSTAGTGVGILGLQALAGGHDQSRPGAKFPVVSPLIRRDEPPAPKQHAAPLVARQDKTNSPDEEKVTITGRVLDPNGQIMAGADVALIAWARRPLRSPYDGLVWRKPLGETNTDGQGDFRLTVSLSSKDGYRKVFLLARAPGFAFGIKDIDPGEKQTKVEVRLNQEEVIRGRLVDLQGQAASDVRIHVTSIVGQFPERSHLSANYPETPQDPLSWPESTVTNDQGKFSLRGLARDWTVTIKVDHDRFAPQYLELKPEDRTKDAPVTRALATARWIEGDVTFADTGKPVPKASVKVHTQPAGHELNPGFSAEGQADDHGRFRISLPLGRYVTVKAHPPAGTPYLPLRKSLNWPKADVINEEIHMALPRGILVKGIVRERAAREEGTAHEEVIGSASVGKPLAGAQIDYEQFQDGNPFYRDDVGVHDLKAECMSGPDGKFELALLPGPSHLLINGPTLDYLHADITTKQLNGSRFGPNRRNYYDAIIPLNLKPQAGPADLTVTLRRGVTLTGRVLGPDGKPVEKAKMLCRSYIPYGHDWNPAYSKEVENGQFELPGCDPQGTSEVYFLDAKNQLGTVANLSGKDAGKPVIVRLERCGSATVRLVDEQSKPISDFDTWVEILLTPGIHHADEFLQKTGGKPEVLADTAHDPAHTRGPTDSEGRITFSCLIPGATYWVSGQNPPRWWSTNLRKEIKVRPGESLDLGEIRVKAPK